MTELENVLPRLKNFHVEIAEEGSELVFLYRISPGGAEKSYGVYAAKLAGLPRPVVRRAEELLIHYETQENISTKETPRQTSQSPERESSIVRELLATDINSLSPVEALMKLFELRKLADEEAQPNVRVAKRA